MKCTTFSHVISAGKIDPAAGVIKGVSVITEGPALGHEMSVDSTTLQQVQACALAYKDGLKVKMNHGGGAESIVGYLTNFSIDGRQLRADLHLLSSAPMRGYILELAGKIPKSFGLSIAFSGTHETRGERRLARCSEIYSADIVDAPAANANGLFSSSGSENKRFETLVADRVAGGESEIEAIKYCLGKHPQAHADYLARVRAGEVVRFGAAHRSDIVGLSFEQLVRAGVKQGMKTAGAVGWAVKLNPDQHAEYLRRVRAGEIIKL